MTGTETRNQPRHGRRILTLICAAMLGVGAIQSTSWANPVQPTPLTTAGTTARTTIGTTTAPSATRSDLAPAPTMDQAYAAREAEAKSLESFKGGDVVIIGGTGLVIVLLVILILVIA